MSNSSLRCIDISGRIVRSDVIGAREADGSAQIAWSCYEGLTWAAESVRGLSSLSGDRSSEAERPCAIDICQIALCLQRVIRLWVLVNQMLEHALRCLIILRVVFVLGLIKMSFRFVSFAILGAAVSDVCERWLLVGWRGVCQSKLSDRQNRRHRLRWRYERQKSKQNRRAVPANLREMG